MTHEQAIQFAIAALAAETARVQIDADLYDGVRSDDLVDQDFRTPRRATASKQRADCRKAIEVLRGSQQTVMALEAKDAV